MIEDPQMEIHRAHVCGSVGRGRPWRKLTILVMFWNVKSTWAFLMQRLMNLDEAKDLCTNRTK